MNRLTLDEISDKFVTSMAFGREYEDLAETMRWAFDIEVSAEPRKIPLAQARTKLRALSTTSYSKIDLVVTRD